MTKLEKIKAAVRGGAQVHEGTPDGGYLVKCFSYAGKVGEEAEQWCITFAPTKWMIGLTWRDEKTLNGKRFFLNGKEILDDPEPESVLSSDLTDGGSEGEW